jgi:hypothetical protein
VLFAAAAAAANNEHALFTESSLFVTLPAFDRLQICKGKLKASYELKISIKRATWTCGRAAALV